MTATSNTDPRALLAAAVDANRPVLLMGAPGTAKTAMVEDLAAQRGAYLEIVIASAQDPTTILGIPMPSEDRKYTEPTTPGWARRIIEADARGEDTMLFLDELTTVPEHVAGPLLGVVQSRRADGWALPASTRIIAAANPPDLAVGGWALAPAMANRWVHVEWGVPVDEWRQWATAQGGTLAAVAEYIGVMGADALLAVPTDHRKRSGAWPSPRSWTNGAAMVDATGNPAAMAAAVGDAAALSFAEWLARRDIPTPEALRTGADIPTRSDALTQALSALTDSTDDDNLGATLAVLRRAIAIDAGLVQVAARALAARDLTEGIAELADELAAAGVE